jgi:hypothetical protein
MGSVVSLEDTENSGHSIDPKLIMSQEKGIQIIESRVFDTTPVKETLDPFPPDSNTGSVSDLVKKVEEWIPQKLEQPLPKNPEKPINAAVIALQKRQGRANSGSSINSHQSGPLRSQRSNSSISLNEYFSAEKREEHIKDHSKSELNVKYGKLKGKGAKTKLGEISEHDKRCKVIKQYRMKKFNSTSNLYVDCSIVNSDTQQYLK